jgi:uncharacterized protein YndB with AHSA1/START domain
VPGYLTSIEPVRKSVTVPAAPQRAFDLFTAHIQEWWPLATHSVGIEQAVGVAFGDGPGAAITETLADGSTSVWGTITDWEPPQRVAFSWHPGHPVAGATHVEVTFTEDGPGRTVGRLTHSGWERRADGTSARDGYDSGWEPVLASFAQAATRAH